ncbi:MAG: XdhC family protein [Gammaproteobacteria bacterium]
MPALYVQSVLPSLREWRAQGLRTALVTMVATDGSSPRPLGSQMAIAENGKAVGNITGGCAEAAIIAEAQQRIAKAQSGCVRYGAGSPYIDIRLPCGSGIDVYFDVAFPDTALAALLEARDNRRPAWLRIDASACRSEVRHTLPPADGVYARPYPPVTRLVLVGKGPMVPILAALARASDFEVIALSSEPETLEATAPHALRTEYLATPESFRFDQFDAWTAFVSLFHEHEWEPPILERALRSSCFYVGALGSRRTAEARRAILCERGLTDAEIAWLRAPVGLKLGGKNPPEIALAILAEIVQTQYAPPP